MSDQLPTITGCRLSHPTSDVFHGWEICFTKILFCLRGVHSHKWKSARFYVRCIIQCQKGGGLRILFHHLFSRSLPKFQLNENNVASVLRVCVHRLWKSFFPRSILEIGAHRCGGLCSLKSVVPKIKTGCREDDLTRVLGLAKGSE